MLVHDIIKIKYVQFGYIIKNYPYHLISDEEMFNAFIDLGEEFASNLVDPNVRFFDMNYPNPFELEDFIYQKKDINGNVVEEISLSQEYLKLKNYIKLKIIEYLTYYGTSESDKHLIPNWIYTYMLGEVIYQKSEYLDIEDLLELLKCDNLANEFTRKACIECYRISLGYTSALSDEQRPPTVFGEPHIIKSLRLGA